MSEYQSVNAPEQWFINEISSGLQTLYVLSLDRTPAADMISATADIWAQTLWSKPIDWQTELDAQRIRAGFIKLAGAVGRWPSPSEFLSYLPKRKPQEALPATIMDDEQRAKAQAILKNLKDGLTTSDKPKKSAEELRKKCSDINDPELMKKAYKLQSEVAAMLQQQGD